MSAAGHRVFITAAGFASAAGIGEAELDFSLASRKSGVRRLERIDATRLRTTIGGECRIAPLVERLGIKTLEISGLMEHIELSRNPKLLFALHATSSLFEAGAFERLSPENVRLFTGAGLEEISVEALRAGELKGRVCGEPPAAFLGEIISRFHKFGLPPVTLVSACSASTMAVGEAFKSLRAGAVRAAVAGGADSMLSEFSLNAFNSIGALCEDGNDAPEKSVRPFDKSRSGTVLGEGAAYFLLESENGLAESGNRPLAEIAGYGTSMDAFNPVQPDPSGRGAALAMRRALEDAGMRPEDIGYINAHGTGTRHNDVAETLAVKSVFGERKGGCPVISSTKPYFGHLVSAAGAIELLSVLWAFRSGVVPPTLNFTEAGEGCDLDYAGGAEITMPAGAALKNSFGLNGQNASLIIKKIPTKESHL